MTLEEAQKLHKIMTLEQSQKVIRDPTADWVRWVEASNIISTSPSATFEDLIECLKRKGLPADAAVCALYVRTKRPKKDNTLEAVIHDPDDWTDYLRKSKLI